MATLGLGNSWTRAVNCIDNTAKPSASHSLWFEFLPVILLLLYWMEKQSSRRCLFENLQSSGTKVMIKGPIIRQLCVGRSIETNKQTFD